MFLMNNTIFSILITVKKTWYNHIVNAYVVYFVLSIDSWGIVASIFHGCAEVVNYNICNICLVFQGTILVESHMPEWMLSVLKFC